MHLLDRAIYSVRSRLGTAIFEGALRRSGSSLFRHWLYYLVRSDVFQREQAAVFEGRRRYWNDRNNGNGSSTLLRRNIHRLEKGLLMRPRRDLFAVDYIGETVEAFCQRIKLGESLATNPELRWAHAVLTSYFEVTGQHPTIDDCRTRFEAVPIAVANANEPQTPYCRRLSDAPPVSYACFHQLARQRRSVRWFLQKRVPRREIDRALAIAAQSPSACNRQPFIVRVFDEPELARQVASTSLGVAGYVENIQALAVFVGQQRHFFDERDRHLIYVDVGLAAMSFAFALETIGLSSCMINWPDIESREHEMAELIGMERDERPVMLVAFGYPDPEGLVAASVKKPVAQLARYNFE